MADGELIVVALGGNAITDPDSEGNVDDQFANSRAAAKPLADLVERGCRLVVTHGNGPQIGNFLVRNDAAATAVYPLPMEVASAHVQGGMGFMIAQTLANELSDRGHKNVVVNTIITTVLVDHDDPSFDEPTKPIGRFMSDEEAEELRRDGRWTIKEIQPGKFRRVVPSPHPRRVMEIELIKRSVRAGDLLVACGGGGIPVVRDSQGRTNGVCAVIDKDLASALLARELGADTMMILTNVDRICLNFGKPDEKALDRLSVNEAQKWLDSGQFGAGSMGPKVAGALQFLRGSDRADARVIIGSLDQAAQAIVGQAGTVITAQ